MNRFFFADFSCNHTQSPDFQILYMFCPIHSMHCYIELWLPIYIMCKHLLINVMHKIKLNTITWPPIKYICLQWQVLVLRNINLITMAIKGHLGLLHTWSTVKSALACTFMLSMYCNNVALQQFLYSL